MEPNSLYASEETVVHEEHSVAAQPPKKGRNMKVVVAIIVLIVGALVALGFMGYLPLDAIGIPSGNVAAVVNGEKITKIYVEDRLAQARPMLEQQGFDLNDPAVMADLHTRAVDDLVKEVLLIQEAKAAGIEITDEDVATQYDSLVAGLGGQESFDAALAANRLTEEKLRVDLRRQLYVERFVERFSSERGVTVTDPEIATLYAGLKEQNASLPPLEEIRQSLYNELQQQKIAALLSPYLEELRAGANVKIY